MKACLQDCIYENGRSIEKLTAEFGCPEDFGVSKTKGSWWYIAFGKVLIYLVLVLCSLLTGSY